MILNRLTKSIKEKINDVKLKILLNNIWEGLSCQKISKFKREIIITTAGIIKS